LDCRHVCKTCAFHVALQAGKQKEVHPPYSPDLAPARIVRTFINVIHVYCMGLKVCVIECSVTNNQHYKFHEINRSVLQIQG
jgi:hypothetical protein